MHINAALPGSRSGCLAFEQRRQTSDPVNQVTQNSKPGNAACNECKVTYQTTLQDSVELAILLSLLLFDRLPKSLKGRNH